MYEFLLSAATFATAIFTGITAYIMYKDRTQSRTPEIKVRADFPENDCGFFRVSLFFTPAASDYPIKEIKVQGCEVSEVFTYAPFGMPPADNEKPKWVKAVPVEMMIFSEINSRAIKDKETIAPLRPVIAFWVKPKKPLKRLRVAVYPPLLERLALRSEKIVKLVYLSQPNRA